MTREGVPDAVVLEALVAQAKFVTVRNGSKKDGQFVYYAAWIRAAWDELPDSMTWRWMSMATLWGQTSRHNSWMSTATLWDMAKTRDYSLAISSAEVMVALFPQRSRVHKDEEGHGQGANMPRSQMVDRRIVDKRHSRWDQRPVEYWAECGG